MHAPGPSSPPRRRAGRGGAAAAELAIIASVLLVILLVSVDFARAFFAYLTITSCARNGALYGSMNPGNKSDATADKAGMENAALADVSSWSPAPTAHAAVGNDADGNHIVSVQVSYTFQTLIAYPGIAQDWPFSRTVQMRVTPGQPGLVNN